MISKELRHILYVDDDPDMEMLVKATLENQGKLRVTTCSNPIDFLLTAMESKPDLIILDVMMEWMSGIEVYRELKKNDDLNHIPVIFLTSRVDPDDIEKYLSLGALGVIAKPFDIVNFPRKLDEIWRRHHGD